MPSFERLSFLLLAIIHRVAAILAMEEGWEDEPLAEMARDGKLDGETIKLTEDEGG